MSDENSNKKVLVYSTPTCPFCVRAKEFFKTNDIAFEDYDVASDEDKRNEMLEKSGQMGVPVIDVKGTVIVGFNEPRLRELLDL